MRPRNSLLIRNLASFLAGLLILSSGENLYAGSRPRQDNEVAARNAQQWPADCDCAKPAGSGRHNRPQLSGRL